MLPVRKISLYNNGFCVMERSGKVEGSAEVNLYFKSSDMEEVLKSLHVTDLNGGKITNVSYQSTRSDAEIENILIQIPDANSLTGLLQSLKGSNVSITSDKQQINGTIVGIEDFTRTDGTSGVFLNLFVGSRSIQSFDLLKITSIDFSDEHIRKDIQHALELYIARKNQDLKKVTIYCTGEGSRNINAQYTVQLEEWQTNYRINLIPDSKQAVLEGFAIVYNPQDEDLEDVKLTLVTGAPRLPSQVSTSSSSGTMNVNVKILNSGRTFSIYVDPNNTVEELKKKISQKEGLSVESQKLVFAGKPLEEGRTLSDYNIQAEASIVVKVDSSIASNNAGSGASKVANIFKMADQSSLSFYEIPTPVSVKRNQSAIVPILNSKLDYQYVVLYNHQIKKGNPLCAILFQNTTGLTIQGGSMMISEGSKILGEAKIENMKPKDETLMPFAIEQGVEVAIDNDVQKHPINRVTVKTGEIKFFNHLTQRTIYTVLNQTTKKFNFFLDHLFLDPSSGYELVETIEPVDINDRYYRFSFEVPENKKTVFNVREKTTDVSTQSVKNISIDIIERYIAKKYFPKEVIEQFRKVVTLNNDYKKIALEIVSCERDVRENLDTQERLRKNIDILKDSPKEGAKYIKELGKEDDNLVQLQAQIKDLREKQRRIDIECNNLAASIQYQSDIAPPAEEEKKTPLSSN